MDGFHGARKAKERRKVREGSLAQVEMISTNTHILEERGPGERVLSNAALLAEPCREGLMAVVNGGRGSSPCSPHAGPVVLVGHFNVCWGLWQLPAPGGLCSSLRPPHTTRGAVLAPVWAGRGHLDLGEAWLCICVGAGRDSDCCSKAQRQQRDQKGAWVPSPALAGCCV